MKKLNLFLVFLLISLNIVSYSQIGVLTNTPDASSALDIVSTTKGLLIPRVTLTSSLSSPSPVTSPATGLLVYNSGANQPEGFYYWSGSSWVKLETGTGTITSWELTGNSGTTVGTNFVGTTDDEALAFNTNGVEKLRILSDGRISISNGYTAPDTEDKLTITANSTNINALYATSDYGYAVLGISSNDFAMRAHSSDANGNGILATGNNVSGSYLNSGSGGSFTGGTFGTYTKAVNGDGNGILSLGNNVSAVSFSAGSGGTFLGTSTGIYSLATDSDGTGIAVAGNNQSISTFSVGSGASIRGAKYGTYTKALNVTNGTGIAAVGNGGSSAYVLGSGSGGAFTGADGIYGKATNSTDGVGVIGLGNNYSTYHTTTTGTGGAFSGFDGLYGHASTSDGIGVIGLGNNGSTYHTLADGTGTGGAFTGFHGLYGHAVDEDGTGVIGVGNDGSTYHTLPDGSGGAFSGFHGVYGYAEDGDDGIGVYGYTEGEDGVGVVGVGNDESRLTMGDGGGGSFTGYRFGIESFAKRSTGGTGTRGVYGRFSGGGNNDGVGVFGYSYPNSGYGYGVIGQGRYYGVYSSGNLGASGTKSFVIDHPLDPENKILKHYTIESPEVLNMYRGNVLLDENGEAVINLPEYFIEINTNFSYNLTPIGQHAPNLFIKEEISDQGSFIISGGISNQKISWVVYAERNDLYMKREKETNPEMVEIEKKPNEKGKYFMPELYNQPMEMGILYSGKKIEKKVDNHQNKSQSRKVVKGKDTSEKEIIAEEIQVKEKDD